MATVEQEVATDGQGYQLTTMMQQMQQAIVQLSANIGHITATQAQQAEDNQQQIRMLQTSIARLTTLTQSDPPVDAPISLTPATGATSTTTPSSCLADSGEPGPICKPRAILPDPLRFGGQCNKFRPWLLEMTNKLHTDGRAIGDEGDQFRYIYTRLEAGAQQMATIYITSHSSDRSPISFLNYLESCYGDPDIAEKAVDKIKTLTQGRNQPFAQFYPNFEVILAEAGGAGWDNSIKKAMLKVALNENLYRAIAGQIAMPQDWTGYVLAVRKLSSQLEAFSDSKQDRNANQQTVPCSITNLPAINEMDWETTRSGSLQVRQAPGHCQAVGYPKEVDDKLQGKQAKWVDQSEIDRRGREGYCYRCGRSACRIGICPLLPAIRPDGKSRVSHTAPKQDIAAIDEEESSPQGVSDKPKNE